jgi:hypothetical protein
MGSDVLPTILAGIGHCNTHRYSQPTFFIQTIAGMRDEEEEARREVLRGMISTQANGVIAKFCSQYPELNPVQISTLTREGSDKAFGAKVARNLEKKMGLPRYALDGKVGANSMEMLEHAIQTAGFLEDSEKKHWIAIFKSLEKGRK